MTNTVYNPVVITCPICGSDSAALRHDLRCSLLYFCEECEHEWQIDPGDEPPPVAPRQPASPRAVVAAPQASRKP